jgi:hypothetical protein
MLEIKSYEDWSTEDKGQDKVEKLKNYTDYVRSSYFKSGGLNQKVEDEIQFGAKERLKMEGVLSDDTPEEEAKSLVGRVVGAKQDQDSDARFVLEHLRNSADDLDPANVSTKTATLSRYLDTKNAAPNSATEMDGAVSEILKDRDLVKKARISAVDRGDFDVVAIDTDKGRQLYSSPYAKPETVNGSIDALLKNGAVSTADLVGIKDLVSPINGGISTNAKLSSYAAFEQAAVNYLKGDADANEVVTNRAGGLTEQKRKEQLTTGENVFEAVKGIVAKPFDWAAEKIVEGGAAVKAAVTGEKVKEPTPNKYGEDATLYDILSQNKAFTDKFSPEILKEFSDNLEIRKSMPAFRADKPETGIMTDTLGNPIISPSLLPKKELFEQALNSSTLNNEQKSSARLGRQRDLEAVAPNLKNLILSEEPEAVSEYAKARAQGLTDSQFIESWVSKDENYNGFNTRLEQLGKGFIKSVVELPLGLVALAGNESAAKAMGALQKDQSDRQEYSRLFGDEYGLGFQLINTVPQVGTDIVATIATGGLGGAIKTGVKATAKNVFRNAAKTVVSELDEAAVIAGKAAVEVGGDATTGAALKTIGDSVATKLGQATELAPLLAVSFTRSAGSTYGSIYNQLPDTLSHEEKHKQSFGYAIASGISTAAITGGMSFLGRGAVEDIATKKLRAMAAGETDDAIRAAGGRPIPLDELNFKQSKTLWQNIKNEGRAVKDEAFIDAMNSAIGSSYKNFIRTSLGGFKNEAFEEALDQAIQIKLEDAATDRETPLTERLNQIWAAGILGGSLGGITSTIGQLTPVTKSDVAIALEAKASGLKDIADRLSKAGSPSTMEIVQRQMDNANAELARQTQIDIKNSEDAQKRAKTSSAANPYDKPLKFDEEGQSELELGVAPTAPKKTQFLADVVGRRGSVGGYTGSVEMDDDGNVRLALDDVRDDGVTHINIGPKLMAVSKSGYSDRNALTVLGTDNGTIKAGTPFVVPDRKTKSQFAFPEAAENVVVLPSLGGVDAILVRNTRMIGQENATRDVVITDPDQIEDTLKYYKLDPKMVAEQKDVGQLELDLFGEPAPAPVAEAPASEQLELPLTEGQPPVAVQEQPVQKKVSPEIETAREMVVGNPLVAELRLLATNGFKPEEINKVATQFTPEQFIDLETRLSAASKFALELDDTKEKERNAIRNSVESLTAINERVKVARIIPASAPQVVEAAPEAAVVETPAAPAEPVQGQIKWDVKGIGSVPNQVDLSYRGFEMPMLPSDFRKMVPEGVSGAETKGFIKEQVAAGEAIAPPFLEAEWDKKRKVWVVDPEEHEGRSRTDAAAEINPNSPMPVSIFPKKGMRARSITEEMRTAPIVLRDNLDKVVYTPPQAAPTTAPVEPTTTAATPDAPAEPAKQKKAKGKRRAVTPIEGTTVVDNPEDPAQQVVELEVKKDSLAETTMIPDFFRSAPPITLVEADKKVTESLAKIAADRAVGISVPPTILQAVHIMATRVNKAKKDLQIETNNIDQQIVEIEKPDEQVKTDVEVNRDHLIAIINGEKLAPEAAIEKAKKVVAPSKPFESEDGVFQNETTAQLFSDFVINGYFISNLTAFGFPSNKVSGLSLNTPRAKDLPVYQVEIKQRMAAAIKERFPFIEAPETGIETVKSKVPFGNMDGSGSVYLPLPMVTDSEGKPLSGFFTNDPRVTAAQMDLGKKVFVPKPVLKNIKNGKFNLNPSITIDEKTGLVKKVELYPEHSGVYGAGDLSMVGTSGYEFRGEFKPMQLDSLLVEPAARYLDNAGPTARNRSAVASTYETFIDDAVSSGELYENVPLEETAFSNETQKSKIGNILIGKMNLDHINAEHVVLNARMDHSLQLKEFGLASRLNERLIKERLQKPDAVIEDLDLPKLVLQSMKGPDGRTPSGEYAASILRSNGYGGDSAESVLTNYASSLYERITVGKYAKGVTSFQSLVLERGRKAVRAQKRRGTLDVKMKTVSVDAAAQTQYPESKSAFQAMSQLISESDDVRASVIAAEEDNLTQLVDNLDSNDTMYDLLFGIVEKSVPDLSPMISSEELVDVSSRILSSRLLEERKAISESLSKSTEGLKLANLLLEAGWLPPVGKAGRVIPPSMTAALSPQERAKAMKPPTSNEAIRENVRAMKQLARTNLDIKLSISDEVTLTADAARKMNQAELDKLGVRSGDTESVVEAFRQIAETGKPQHRRVAALLVQSPELIRNVNFNIGDFNDVRFAGAFMPKSNLVVINLSGHNGRGIADVLLHEFLHAETHQIMTNPKTPMQRKALARITALRNLTKVEAGKRGLESDQFVDALGDDVEFLAYALTDVKFQGIITDATPTGQRSLLRRIVDAILNFFGIDKDANLSDPLEELIDFARMFATDTTYNINYKSTIRNRAEQVQDVIASFRAELQMYNRSLQPDVRYKRSGIAALDAAYAAAVEGGDLVTAQQLVNEAARRAGYDTVGYHASGAPINVFDPNISTYGFWFADNEEAAANFKKWRDGAKTPFVVTKAFLKLDNPQEYANFWRHFVGDANRFDTRKDWKESLQAAGRRSARIEDDYWLDSDFVSRGEQYITFEPSQIKSAESVTFDDNGNVIPLSQRFQITSPDIRFARKSKLTNEQLDYLADLEAELEGGEPAMLSAIVEEKQLPTTDGWLFRDGTFMEVDLSTQGNAEAALVTHRDSIITVIVDKHESALEEFLDEKGVESQLMLDDNDIYELAKRLGYARVVSSGTELYVEATGELSARQRSALKDASIESEMSVIRDLGPNRARQFVTLFDGKLQFSPATEVDEPIERFEGALTGVAIQLADLLPANINVEFDSTLDGEAAVSRADFRTVRVNAENLYKRVANMNKRGAKASIRSLIDHELAHIAVGMEFTPDEVAKVAGSLGEQRLQQIAEEYYSATGLTADEIRNRVATDRESGRLTNSDIADEWLRMTVTKVATGRTAENDIRYALKDPTLLDAVVRSIQAFITKLRQLFADYPTAETAAMVSRASRTFNKIRKGNVDLADSNVMEDARFGDSESFLAALDGAPEVGRTMYALPVMSSNPKKVDGFMGAVKSKMYNLPAELRAINNMRTGTINTISASMKDFIRDFPKMRDAAIAAGVSEDDIKTLFGTTAPPLTDAALKDINNKVDSFEAQLDTTGLTDEQVEQRILDYREALKRDERLKFNTEFRKKQVAAEKAVADAGFGGLVSKAIALRTDINKMREYGGIGFDESNDVYLTRAYRYFTTEGWAMAARSGGQITVDGKVVDFEKLRNTVAQSYREQAEIVLSKRGRPYTEQDVSDMTLDMLDKYLEALETMTKTTDRIAVDSLRKDLNRFKPKKDIDSTFRELLGEIEDPVANAANTLFKVGMMAANEQFRNQFAQTAIDLGLASKRPKPDYVQWRSESSFATMGPLAGLWFDPKIAGVLDETFGVNMANHMANSTKMMSKIGRGVSRASGFAVQMKTQLGLGYWPRNAIGGYLMGAAQGIFWNPMSDAGRESVIQAARGAFSRLPTEENQRDAILRLVQLNVLNDQSQGRVVQDMIRGLIATPEQELQELMADIEEARATKDAGGVVARMKQKGLIKGVLDVAGSKYSSFTDLLGALDGMIDGLYKVNAYYFERGIIDRHFGKSMSEAEKDEAAARKIKLVFAGHSQVIDPVQSFNRTPLASIFLPFARWKSEVFRTMLNTVPLAMEEINQGGLMARRGTRRLAGFIGTLTAAPVIIGTLASMVFRALAGDDEDEERMLDVYEKAALREALPDWQRGHSLYAQVLKGNKIQFIDMTYILPYSQLTDLVGIISDGYRTGRGLEGSKLASYVVNDIIGVQIAASSVGEILSNQDNFGQPIYVETDPAPVKMSRMLMHYGKNAMVPSFGLKGYEALRTGQQNTGDILLGEVLGARPRTLTFGEVERRAFRNLKSLQDSSVGIIGELVSGRYKSQDDVDSVVNRHQDAMNQTQARLSNFIRTMKALGSPESSIAASAKASRFSSDTIQSANAGYRIAWRPNKAWADKAYANTKQGEEQDPNERIRMVLDAVNKKPDVYWINDPIE